MASWLCGAAAACGSGPDRTVVVDQAPTIAEVRDGAGADLDEQLLTTSLFANWDPLVDPEGLPVVYEWSIGRAPRHADVFNWTRVGTARRAATGDVTLPRDVTLYVNVRAIDIAGNRSAIASSDPPSVPHAPRDRGRAASRRGSGEVRTWGGSTRRV